MYVIISNNGVDTMRGEEMRVKSCEQKKDGHVVLILEKKDKIEQHRDSQRFVMVGVGVRWDLRVEHRVCRLRGARL